MLQNGNNRELRIHIHLLLLVALHYKIAKYYKALRQLNKKGNILELKKKYFSKSHRNPSIVKSRQTVSFFFFLLFTALNKGTEYNLGGSQNNMENHKL